MNVRRWYFIVWFYIAYRMFQLEGEKGKTAGREFETPVDDPCLVSRYQGCNSIEDMIAVDKGLVKDDFFDEFGLMVEFHEDYPGRLEVQHCQATSFLYGMSGHMEKYFRAVFASKAKKEQKRLDALMPRIDDADSLISMQTCPDGKTIFSFEISLEQLTPEQSDEWTKHLQSVARFLQSVKEKSTGGSTGIGE
jgi:hypothetical protein